jgi:citrate synthase
MYKRWKLALICGGWTFRKSSEFHFKLHDNTKGYIWEFFVRYQPDHTKQNATVINALDKLFILHADHSKIVLHQQ